MVSSVIETVLGMIDGPSVCMSGQISLLNTSSQQYRVFDSFTFHSNINMTILDVTNMLAVAFHILILLPASAHSNFYAPTCFGFVL